MSRAPTREPSETTLTTPRTSRRRAAFRSQTPQKETEIEMPIPEVASRPGPQPPPMPLLLRPPAPPGPVSQFRCKPPPSDRDGASDGNGERARLGRCFPRPRGKQTVRKTVPGPRMQLCLHGPAVRSVERKLQNIRLVVRSQLARRRLATPGAGVLPNSGGWV